MKKLILLFLCPLLLLPASAQFVLSGRIVSRVGQNPVAEAAVSLEPGGYKLRSDAEGRFRFEQLPARSYTLSVSASGYSIFETNVRGFSGEVQLDGISLLPESSVSEEVIISALRAGSREASTYSSMNRKDIAAQNNGQDMPFVLNQLPSVVVNSDAGAGIGYTGIRIRGSDPTRINVTVNGIPLNDPESHFVFWVNMPDFASSVDNLQVQRGVGTSTNGGAAFGASINLQTSTLKADPYAEYTQTFGSFNTRRHSLSAGTGLLKERFAFDVRLSRINSDGYMDRARADLSSWFVSGAYYGKKQLLKFNAFSGREETYQAWWGVPEARLSGDSAALNAHIQNNLGVIYRNEQDVQNLLNSDRRYNYYSYDNEVDNYRQDHYQLLYSASPSQAWSLNAALHYTMGKGYFEQFRLDNALADYGLPPVVFGSDTLSRSDLIRRRWLDNDFYGAVFSVRYTPGPKTELTWGGGLNRYDGAHFGEIIWMRWAGASNIRERYYQNRGLKDDAHSYLKGIFQLSPTLRAYADLQLRHVLHRLGDESLAAPGRDNDQRPVSGRYQFLFFNPKAGLSWNFRKEQQLYLSYALGNREPIRSDFIDAPEGRTPLPESLFNLEAGYRLDLPGLLLRANLFRMDYLNQLVLNGELNDVGAAIRENVRNSFRQGIELETSYLAGARWRLGGNLALSQNRIRSFDEILYDYGTGETIVLNYRNSPISFSPAIVGGATVVFTPLPGLEFSWLQKYVGRQFMDNTGDRSRSLAPFNTTDLRASLELKPVWMESLRIALQVNNLFNAQYAPNGYTYSYLFEGARTTENFYYPQAGTNFLLNLSLGF